MSTSLFLFPWHCRHFFYCRKHWTDPKPTGSRSRLLFPVLLCTVAGKGIQVHRNGSRCLSHMPVLNYGIRWREKKYCDLQIREKSKEKNERHLERKPWLRQLIWALQQKQMKMYSLERRGIRFIANSPKEAVKLMRLSLVPL